MKTSVERQVVIGFILSVLALAGIGSFSYYSTTNLVATEQWVSHTHEVIATLESGRAMLTDAETSQRGYLLTGSQDFLNDCQTAQQKIADWQNSIRRLTADNPEELKRLDNLDQFIAIRLKILNNRIQLRQEKGLQAAADGVATREGKTAMDQIDHQISLMCEAEDMLLEQRQSAAHASAHVAETVILMGSIFTILACFAALRRVLRDLRLREQAEQKIEAARLQLQAILDHTPAVIFLKDLQERYLFVNRRFEEVSGLKRGVSVGRRADELFTPEMGALAHEHFLRIMSAQTALEFEEMVHYTDGPRPHLAVKFPLRDSAGKVYAVAGISSDITARKKMEELHLHFRALFESLPGLYVVLKPDFTMVAVSDAYLHATMVTREQVLNRNLFEVFPDNPDEKDATGAANLRTSLNRVQKTLKTDTMAIQKYDVRRPDGVFEERFWSPVNSPVVDASGNLQYIIHRVEDVTEFVRQKNTAQAADVPQERLEKMEAEIFHSSQELQTANEQLRFANQELEAFSYSVSHDLRAPLRHINGFVDLLSKQAAAKLNERELRYLNVIADSARQMGTLIDNLLVFSRMSRSDLRRAPVSSNSLLEEAVATLQTELSQRHITWQIAALPQVEGDAAMLRQVWINLVGNALKYTRTRSPAAIEIGFSTTDTEHVFFVRDDGVGFDMQYAAKLFGVFQRLHRSEEFEGTGIGLANVRRIVTRHGGRTWAEGKVDAGATFFFSLPKIKNK